MGLRLSSGCCSELLSGSSSPSPPSTTTAAAAGGDELELSSMDAELASPTMEQVQLTGERRKMRTDTESTLYI